MSKIALNGNANGNGTFTIASPNSNSDRILNLPDSAGTLATAESTLTQFNASGSAPVYAARAWVNFNGTGTVAIRASGNVSSITDNAAGNYTVNFTTAMQDADYAANVSCQPPDATNIGTLAINPNSAQYSTSGFRFQLNNTGFTSGLDPVRALVSVFR